jgi:hypothetical protein
VGSDIYCAEDVLIEAGIEIQAEDDEVESSGISRSGRSDDFVTGEEQNLVSGNTHPTGLPIAPQRMRTTSSTD